MENVLIIITGQLAAEKTTYDKQISQVLKIPYLSKDVIKEVLFDSLFDNNASYEEKKKLGVTSYD